MEKKVKNLLVFVKKVISKSKYEKLKIIEDKKEQEEAVKYVIVSALKTEYSRLEKEIESLENKSKDVFFVKNKFMLLPSKIKQFQVDFDETDFYKLMKLIGQTRFELQHV